MSPAECPTPPADTPRRGRERLGAPVPVTGFAGVWLVVAAAALVAATGIGFISSVALGGALGRSVGGGVASLLLAATAVAVVSRARIPGLLALRALDVLWGLVLGVLLPFVAGVFAVGAGWPAFGALSPRWIALGVVAPIVSAAFLTVFAVGLVYPAVLRTLSSRVSPLAARIAAGALTAVAFVVVPMVFRDDVSGMPPALPIVLGLALGIFVGLSQRLWGPLIVSTVFAGVWVCLSVLGALLA